MVRKLSKSERLIDEQMLALLEWAVKRPACWHYIGKIEASIKAGELLEKHGVSEVWPERNQYRLGRTAAQ